MMNQLGRMMAAAALATTMTACGSEEAPLDSADKSGSLNVSQGGAQDFEQFRTIIEEGGVPAPDLLDPVGFMAEHAFDLPEASCGKSICMHPGLAVAPRFDGTNWTMAYVAMNTPIDPDNLERPPMHLVVAIEAEPALGHALAENAQKLLEPLRDDDRVTFLEFGSDANVLARALTPEEALQVLPDAPAPPKGPSPQAVDLYDGLATARAEAVSLDGHAPRVLLLTTGRADAGITAPEHVVSLGEAMAREEIAIGVVGYGPSYDATIPRQLGSLGAGTYSYASDEADLGEVLAMEGETTLYPLATDFRLRVEPAPGYRIGRIYGAKRAFVGPDGAVLDMPALFIGQRSGSADVGGSRRGGGGGLFVELIADPEADVAAGSPAFTVRASWEGPETAESQDLVVSNELPPGVNPSGMWPSFSNPDMAKPFMVLNMYLAFRASVRLYDGGDCARALGVIDMMAPSVEGWQGKFDDPDITDDYGLMLMLRANLEQACRAHGVEPIEPVGLAAGCMFI